jgi:predicted outer membrane repeat protein
VIYFENILIAKLENISNLYNCSFINNSAIYGGAVYSNNSYFSFKNNLFRNNSAFVGAALYYKYKYLDIK